MQFNKCNNATSTVTCKSQAAIDAVFNNYQLMATYPRLFIDPNNYDQPVTIKREYFVIRASSTLSKQMRIALHETEFSTDSGFIIAENTKESYITLNNIWSDVTDDGKNELTAIIYMTGTK